MEFPDYVGSGSVVNNNAATNTATISYTSSPNPNSELFLVIGMFSTTLSSSTITDSEGNFWLPFLSITTVGSVQFEIWKKCDRDNPALPFGKPITSVTVTLSANAKFVAAVVEYSNVIIDLIGSFANNTGSDNLPQIPVTSVAGLRPGYGIAFCVQQGAAVFTLGVGQALRTQVATSGGSDVSIAVLESFLASEVAFSGTFVSLSSNISASWEMEIHFWPDQGYPEAYSADGLGDVWLGGEMY